MKFKLQILSLLVILTTGTMAWGTEVPEGFETPESRHKTTGQFFGDVIDPETEWPAHEKKLVQALETTGVEADEDFSSVYKTSKDRSGLAHKLSASDYSSESWDLFERKLLGAVGSTVKTEKTEKEVTVEIEAALFQQMLISPKKKQQFSTAFNECYGMFEGGGNKKAEGVKFLNKEYETRVFSLQKWSEAFGDSNAYQTVVAAMQEKLKSQYSWYIYEWSNPSSLQTSKEPEQDIGSVVQAVTGTNWGKGGQNVLKKFGF